MIEGLTLSPPEGPANFRAVPSLFVGAGLARPALRSCSAGFYASASSSVSSPRPPFPCASSATVLLLDSLGPTGASFPRGGVSPLGPDPRKIPCAAPVTPRLLVPPQIRLHLTPSFSIRFKLIQNKRLDPPVKSITSIKQGGGGVT